MPQALAVIPVAIGALVSSKVIAIVASIAISIISSFVLKALAPKPPSYKPSDGQANIRQAIGPRRRIYGYAKHGGQIVYFNSKDGRLWMAAVLHDGEVEDISAYYLNDKVVTLDGDGLVQTAPYVLNGTELVRITDHLGADGQTVDTRLNGAFSSDWTSSHKLEGLAYFVVNFRDTSAEDFNRVYPQGRPEVTALIQGINSIVDLRDGSTGWTDNAALCIYDFITNPLGMALDAGLVDAASFAAFANVCDELVTTSGGTEKRYRVWLNYSEEDEPISTLRQMLDACAAELYHTPAGKLGIRGGVYPVPTVVLDDDQILEADMARGADALARYNKLRFRYTDPNIYIEIDGDPWIDADLLAAVGGVEESATADFLAAPSHTQARRLAKIKIAQDNPEWVGRIKTTLAGLDAWTEEAVHLTISELGIDGAFAVDRIEFNGDMTVNLDVRSLDFLAWSWTTAEEGTEPGTGAIAAAQAGIDTPTGFGVSPFVISLDGTNEAITFKASWTNPNRDSLSHELEFKKSTEEIWQRIDVHGGITVIQTSVVEASTNYDFRLRAVGPTGVASSWTSTETVSSGTTSGGATPDVPTSLSATGSDYSITVAWTQPSTSSTTGANIYRYTSNNFASAMLVGTKTAGPSVSTSFRDYTVTTGVTYHYWVAAYNSVGSTGTEAYAGSDSATIPSGGEP